MRSQYSSFSVNHDRLSSLGFLPSRKCFFLPATTRNPFSSCLCRRRFSSAYATKLQRSKYGCTSRGNPVRVGAMDEDSLDISALDDWGEEESGGHVLPSSDSEDSDGEILINPLIDVDLPSGNERLIQSDEAVTVTAHRLAMLGRGYKKIRSKYGILNNLGLITFVMMLLSLMDWCAWRIVRLPLIPFYLTRPFLVSAVLASSVVYICVPLLDSLKIHQISRAEGPVRHKSKKRTPTMAGLFFVPVGIIVAEVIVGFSSIELSAAALATVAFAAIGFLDDIISFIKNHNYGLSPWMKIFLEVAVATWYSFWLDTASISSPYGMKLLIPLPAPLGLVCLGKYYLFLTSFCFVSMGNGVNLTDGLDGLAGGTAALAFIGMSIAVLPICPGVLLQSHEMLRRCRAPLVPDGTLSLSS
ncbi:phospho-N-acetylmuramoyl-pentapeptide-transferase homolog isoform X2 [Malania oleifera]|uniref:phospho-N-acetylmuramoyl-pentapeptide- transferase homolog isoform X2 n=1 Tax=Malania oleifera TaxID=397392 RepID=UPI0025AE23E3|nr:phospho-N-acetylmuramoyl-pentapeptide-transferase homolog isoform X2 [Malania oleifera]